MLLPIYVSLEKIDPRLMDAASDLYSPFRRTFRKVILPLSLPGVFAGTLLTFIPATGDFINAEFLGDPESKRVIGNAVRTQFLEPERLSRGGGDQLRADGDHHHDRVRVRQVPRHGRPRVGVDMTKRPLGTSILYIVTSSGSRTCSCRSSRSPCSPSTNPTGKFNTVVAGLHAGTTGRTPSTSSDYLDAFGESIKVALIACTIATVLGGLMSLAVSRYRMPGRRGDQPAADPAAHDARDRHGRLAVHVVLQPGRRAGILDDRDRPHPVLRVVRGAHGQGPASVASTGRSRMLRPISGRRHCGRSPRSPSR